MIYRFEDANELLTSKFLNMKKISASFILLYCSFAERRPRRAFPIALITDRRHYVINRLKKEPTEFFSKNVVIQLMGDK